MEYYIEIKKNTTVAAWLNLPIIMLSEKSQKVKETTCIIPLI